jgi:hypothetical protein
VGGTERQAPTIGSLTSPFWMSQIHLSAPQKRPTQLTGSASLFPMNQQPLPPLLC